MFSVNKAKYLKEVPDMTGKVIIVTGSNTGIGFETAVMLAEKGATLVMACRSKERAEPAVELLKTKVKGAKAEFMPVDLSSEESINSFIKNFKEKYDRLDVLINNAGVAKGTIKAAFGTDLLFGVNIVAPYLLAVGLSDILSSSGTAEQPSRIVTVGSMMEKFAASVAYNDPGNEKKASKEKRYAQSKLAVLFMAGSLNRLFEEKGLNVVAVTTHPGFTVSNMSRDIAGIFNRTGQSTYMGALPSIAAASFEGIKGGEYVVPKRGAYGRPVITQGTKAHNDTTKQDECYKFLSELTKVTL